MFVRLQNQVPCIDLLAGINCFQNLTHIHELSSPNTENIRAPVRATGIIHFAEVIWLGLRGVQPRTYVSDPFFMII